METLRCPKCNGIIDPKDEYCRYCGCNLKKPTKTKEFDPFEADNFSIDDESVKPSIDEKSLSNSHTSSTEDLYDYSNGMYSDSKIGRIRFGFICGILLMVILLVVGVHVIVIGLDTPSGGQTISFGLVFLGALIIAAAVALIIFFIVKLIKSFIDPVMTCIEEDHSLEERYKAEVACDIVEAGLDIISNIIKK